LQGKNKVGEAPPASFVRGVKLGAKAQVTGVSDEELLAAYYGGDDRSFEALFYRYLQALCGFFKRMGLMFEAEDLALETLFRVARTRESGSKFDPDRATPKTWIYRIAKNLALTHLKKTSISPPVTTLESEAAVELTRQAHALPNSAPSQVVDLIWRCIEKELTAQQRIALVLWMTEDLKIKEIADSMDLRFGTVGRLLMEARDKVREVLGDSGFQIVSRSEIHQPGAVIVHVWQNDVLILAPRPTSS
jgi:RNA polymerase sigma-70 factor (ECF subfamily)